MRFGLIARCLALSGIALAVMAQSSGGLFEQPAAPIITYRAAEDKSLDLMVDHQALINNQAPAKSAEAADQQNPASNESFGTPDDPPPRLDLSRPLREGWEMDPVLLNRRQAGEPLRPGDDETNQMLGIQLRKEF